MSVEKRVSRKTHYVIIPATKALCAVTLKIALKFSHISNPHMYCSASTPKAKDVKLLTFAAAVTKFTVHRRVVAGCVFPNFTGFTFMVTVFL